MPVDVAMHERRCKQHVRHQRLPLFANVIPEFFQIAFYERKTRSVKMICEDVEGFASIHRPPADALGEMTCALISIQKLCNRRMTIEFLPPMSIICLSAANNILQTKKTDILRHARKPATESCRTVLFQDPCRPSGWPLGPTCELEINKRA